MNTQHKYLILVLTVAALLSFTRCAHTKMNECRAMCQKHEVTVYKGDGLECVCGR
jgi:hypothetical protein